MPDMNPEFAEVISQEPQNLIPASSPNLPGGVVKFDKLITATANINALSAPVDGKLKINVAGWYNVIAGVTGNLNPLPESLPVLTFSLFLNGVIIDGSTFAHANLSQTQPSNEISCNILAYCNVGDELTLANTSNLNVAFSPIKMPSSPQTNSAYLKVELMRAGPK